MKRKIYLWIGIVAVVLAAAFFAYSKWMAPTRVAFVNYQAISLGSIYKANDNSHIKLVEVSTDELDKLKGFDMVFVNGMGLRIVEEQRQQLQRLADKGVPIYTSMATNPDNNICNLDSVVRDSIKTYLDGGSKKNYRSLLNYVRKVVDGKRFFINEPEPAVERAEDIIYHPNPSGNDRDDDLEFHSVAEYEAWLKKQNLWHEGAHKIVVTGQMADPTGLIDALQKAGMNVYPIYAREKWFDYLNAINPAMVINMAHGRLGDEMVDWLREHNVTMLAPLTVNRLVEDWENDPMGMSGGFMSQSVTMPEIDGAIRTTALFAQYEDKDGYRHSFAVPERLETFVETVKRFLDLRTKPNSEKRVAIYYLKGQGQGATMTAGGMEVAPSLYNFLKRLKDEGYKVDNLPANHRELEKMIMQQGAVLGVYAEGAIAEFMKTGNPELIKKEDYEAWVKQALRPEKYKEVVDANGDFPGQYMATADGRLGVARLQFGNVVVMPQNAAGSGTNAFKILHGTDAAPPHPYIASYLWMRFGFKADALIHFGTHGSLEFTPRKQVALSSNDWPDRLVGPLPHFYVYTIGNVGEGIIAKRRSYATLTSYLTPPFMESSVRGMYRELTEALKIYDHLAEDINERREQGKAPDARMEDDLKRAAINVKAATVKLGIHRDLELDSIAGKPYSEDEIRRVENFAEELATEKITGQLYTMGVPYEPARITSSVLAMATDPIAYGLWALDKLKGRTHLDADRDRVKFTQVYLDPAKELVNRLLTQPTMATDELVCRTAKITPEELAKAREIIADRNAPRGMAAMMMMTGNKKKGGMPAGMPGMPPKGMGGKADAKPAGHPGGMPGGMPPKGMGGMMGGKKKTYTKDEVHLADAIMEVERTILNVNKYKTYLMESPESELRSNMNALKGGYVAPSPGGDPIANPNTLPTGRNLYSINAEATPSEAAWEKGKRLANATIDLYRKRHNNEYPRKVSYTLWSGEFIETEGATIAQILYMLGVEPVRDAFGRVSDLRLIPSSELGRPRIDVVVQTSGQLRDLAASRLFLINRAVEMAAAAKDDKFDNQVSEGVTEAQRTLLAKGLSPREAQEMATYRVFGGVNGNYGTGIQGMVESGDRWEKESEIAETYLHNLGAFYGSEKQWELFRQYAFEAALTRTDVVVQPRQSNTWGALSLDHVYEFMGGMNLSVRHVTGKDPDAYLSDYRNRSNVRMQEVKEAIGVEARTTILNPTYIKEKMKGEASSAGVFAETVRNTYAWNVMKPSAIDNELWDEIFDVYVKDKYDLKVDEFFREQNPATLEEITAVMMETIRKGMWKATPEQIAELARVHTETVNKYGAACSGFVCDNAKLKDFIASKADASAAAQYKQKIAEAREANLSDKDAKSVVLEKDKQNAIDETADSTGRRMILIAAIALVVAIAAFLIIRRRRKN
ncbi:MAG: cobaltochelatase subunit CobN [Tannerella sp.]